MFRMQSILQIAKKGTNRTKKSGSAFMAVCKNIFLTVMLSTSLLLVGSCNETMNFLSVLKKPVQLQALSKEDLIRYAYAMQSALTQKPENLWHMRATDVKLAMAEPELNRRDGKSRIWQYRTEGCVLDIYWMQQGDNPKISHYEFRSRRAVFDENVSIQNEPAWQCIQTLIQQRQTKIEEGFHKSYADLSLNAHKS